MQLDPDRLAAMVSALGDPRFGTTLLDLFAAQRITKGVGYARDGDAAPSCLFAAARDPHEDEENAGLVLRWTSGDYRHDPVLNTLPAPTATTPAARFCDARQVVRDAAQARFVDDYYGHHRLGEQVDFCRQDGDRLFVLSLCRRRDDGPFNAPAREGLAALAPLLLASLQQHAQRQPASRAERLARVRSALLADRCGLTPREADVCAHVVLGHGAEATGLRLGIAAQTVASHRKRAYAKLGIGSQAELFERWHAAAS